MARSPHVKWPFIKVCGIQTIGEGLAALNSGANAIGLLVGLTHHAEDKVDVERAQLITRAIRQSRPDACTVLVTHLLDPEHVKQIAKQIDATAIQVHGAMSPQDMQRLREMMPKAMLIKTIHVEDNGPYPAIRHAQNYASVADAFLTDSKSVDPDGNARLGGTGKRHDPLVGRALVDAFPEIPVIIAGGLTPANISSVIRQIRPAGIDANSGLEHPDGSKDSDKIRAFARTAVRLKHFMRARLALSDGLRGELSRGNGQVVSRSYG